MSENQYEKNAQTVSLNVAPGICGFSCVIEARKGNRETVSLMINRSECEHVQRLSDLVKEITLKGLFAPFDANPVYISAQKARCHSSCPIPSAVLKAVEVAMSMALPKDVSIEFSNKSDK